MTTDLFAGELLKWERLHQPRPRKHGRNCGLLSSFWKRQRCHTAPFDPHRPPQTKKKTNTGAAARRPQAMELNALKIELVDQKTVKITLDENDLDEMSLSFHDTDGAASETKRAVRGLITKIKEETELDLTGGKLFIEAFPDVNGGCVLYVNVIDRNRGGLHSKKNSPGFNHPLIFRFKTLDSLLGACEHLFKQYSHLVRKSSLYLLDQEYFLTLCSYLRTDDKLVKLLSEYGQYFGKGEIRLSFIREHARCIIEDAAVETLVDYVC